MPACLRFRSNFRGSRISKNNERVRGEHLKKITILGHLFREMDIAARDAHTGNFYRFSVRQRSHCCFYLQSLSYSSHDPISFLLLCSSIFSQIGYSRNDSLTSSSLAPRTFLPFFLFFSVLSLCLRDSVCLTAKDRSNRKFCRHIIPPPFARRSAIFSKLQYPGWLQLCYRYFTV